MYDRDGDGDGDEDDDFQLVDVHARSVEDIVSSSRVKSHLEEIMQREGLTNALSLLDELVYEYEHAYIYDEIAEIYIFEDRTQIYFDVGGTLVVMNDAPPAIQ